MGKIGGKRQPVGAEHREGEVGTEVPPNVSSAVVGFPEAWEGLVREATR